MTPEQKVAYVMSQSVAAMAEIESMKAANRLRADNNFADAYGEEAFAQIADRFGIGHNAVIELFRD